MPERKTNFREKLEPNEIISIAQLAKSLGTTTVSTKKWLDENNIKIHKIGLSRIIWSSDLMDHFQTHFEGK